MTEVDYPPGRMQIASLLCPSDGPQAGNAADTNYALNWGDNADGVADDDASVSRGMGVRGRCLGLRDVRDGTTGTLLFAEIGRDDGSRPYQGGMLRNVSVIGWDAAVGYKTPSACVTEAAKAVGSGAAPDPGHYASGADVNTLRGAYWLPAYGFYTGVRDDPPAQRTQLQLSD